MKIYDYKGRKNICGDRVREARKKNRFTQEALAAKLQIEGVWPNELYETQADAAAAEISVRILQDYERGARDINGAKLATLLKICNALECSLRDILTDPATLEGLDEYDKRRS